jgi:hypothetical protein
MDTATKEVSMERPFVAENARERARLRALVARLTDEDLSRPLHAGWTTAAALAHLAFWDQRMLVLIRKWGKSGVTSSPVDVDTMNDALLPLLLALTPRVAANLAGSSAEAIDRELEKASSQLIAEIERCGEVRLNRSIHRKLHLDEIESLLQAKA